MQKIVTIWEDIDEILESGHYRKNIIRCSC